MQHLMNRERRLDVDWHREGSRDVTIEVSEQLGFPLKGFGRRRCSGESCDEVIVEHDDDVLHPVSHEPRSVDRSIL